MTDYTTISSNELLDRLSKEQIIFILNGYDPTYSFLTNNWEKICDHYGTKRQSLIICEFAYVDLTDSKESTEMVLLCDELTKRGYCIRRLCEFEPCAGSCGVGIVSENYFNKTGNVWKFLPSQWSKFCSHCLKNNKSLNIK